MTRTILIKATLFLLIMLSSVACFCQENGQTRSLPLINNKATVKGYAFDKELRISKDSLKKGFTVALEDASYEIVSFTLYYDCESCDIWAETIYGNAVTLVNAPILKQLKAGEVLGFNSFKVKKSDKSFTLPELTIILTD